MTYGEILERAVKKAIHKGLPLNNAQFLNKEDWEEIAHKKYEVFLLNIAFAKYFWGYDKIPLRFNGGNFNMNNEKEGIDYTLAWKYHLQEMVILDNTDRIKYVEKFL